MLLLIQRFPDIISSFAAEATVIILAMDQYLHMEPVQHDAVVYTDIISCLNDWAGRYWEPSPLLYHEALWLLGDKGTPAHFCWIPSHSVIEGNECVDQLVNKSFDHDTDPFVRIQYADLKSLFNSYIQHLVQIK